MSKRTQPHETHRRTRPHDTWRDSREASRPVSGRATQGAGGPGVAERVGQLDERAAGWWGSPLAGIALLLAAGWLGYRLWSVSQTVSASAPVSTGQSALVGYMLGGVFFLAATGFLILYRAIDIPNVWGCIWKLLLLVGGFALPIPLFAQIFMTVENVQSVGAGQYAADYIQEHGRPVSYLLIILAPMLVGFYLCLTLPGRDENSMSRLGCFAFIAGIGLTFLLGWLFGRL